MEIKDVCWKAFPKERAEICGICGMCVPVRTPPIEGKWRKTTIANVMELVYDRSEHGDGKDGKTMATIRM